MSTPSPVELATDTPAWFTGRDPDAVAPVGGEGNLAHRRPHRPTDLARARRSVAAATGTDATRWHLLQQVHGAQVAVVDEHVPLGKELRGVDAAVTACEERPLVVQVADCVPVLLSCRGAVGVAHAGRAGVLAGVLPAAVAALRSCAGEQDVRAAVGPAIGACCYEVPAAMRDTAAQRLPVLAATTTWGTPSLDLPAGARAQLEAEGVEVVPTPAPCTRCTGTLFSHRRDPSSGRQIGLIVRRGAEALDAAREGRRP